MWIDIISVIILPVAALLSLIVMGPRYFIGLEYGLILTGMGIFFYFSLFFLIKHIGMFTDFGFNLCTKYNIDDKSRDVVLFRLVMIVKGIITFVIATVISCSTCTSAEQDLHTLTEAYAWFDLGYFVYEILNTYQAIQLYAKPVPLYAYNIFSFLRAKGYPVVRKAFLHTYLFFIIVSKRHFLSAFITVLKLLTFFLTHAIMIHALLHFYTICNIHLDNKEGINDINPFTLFITFVYMVGGIWIICIGVYRDQYNETCLELQEASN